MKHASSLVAFALALAFASGCAPSVQRLVRDRHYAEALSAVTSRDGPDDLAAERAALAEAIDRDLDVAVHLRAVSPGELSAALGPAADALGDVVVVRVHATSNGVPVESVSVAVALIASSVPIGAAPIGLSASATHASDEAATPASTSRLDRLLPAGAPLHVDELVIWPRSALSTDRPLAVAVTSTAWGPGGHVEFARVIELPTADTVEGRFAQAFGRGEVRLRAAARARVRWSDDAALGG